MVCHLPLMGAVTIVEPWQQSCHLVSKVSTMPKVTIRDEIASLGEYWSQKVIAEANGQLFKVAKGIGEINWHHHDDQDELFILYKGRLVIELRAEQIELSEGELFVVPRGAEHRAKAEEEAAFLIVGLNITSNKQGGKPDWSYAEPT
jgi:quercetin dioxygenase-like cupin family protein